MDNPNIEVDAASGCLLWKGPFDAYGHPVGYNRGRAFRAQHRAYEIEYGLDVRRIEFLPCCKNPKVCVNAAHMKAPTKPKSVEERMADILNSLTKETK